MTHRVIDQFRQTLGQPDGFLVGAAVGAGMTAQAAQAGGADFLLAINAGRMRVMGTSSLAGNLPVLESNRLVDSFAFTEILSQCSVPLFLGSSAMDPRTDLTARIEEAAASGVDGIVNWPTSVLYPTHFQPLLESAGVGFSREIEMLGIAQSCGMAAIAYIGNEQQAAVAAAAGINIICANFGWNTGGAKGISSGMSLEEVSLIMHGLSKAVFKQNPQAILLVEGGPLETAEQVGALLRDTAIHGYVGGSTLERLPIEDSVAARTLAFKSTAQQVARRNRQSVELNEWARQHGLVGASSAAYQLFESIRRQVARKTPVLFYGEAGTPFATIARALHLAAGGEPDTFTTISARHLNATQIERRLFGSSHDASDGLLADNRYQTVLVDGLERLPIRLQARLVRTLRQGWLNPVGGRRRLPLLNRLLFSARTTLENGLGASLIDAEMATLLATGAIKVPALRDRIEDVEALLVATLNLLAPDERVVLTDSARRALLIDDWPGNEAQLQSVAEGLIAGARLNAIKAEDITPLLQPTHQTTIKREHERDLILNALWRYRFNRQETAQYLGISRKTLYNKMQRYGLSDKTA